MRVFRGLVSLVLAGLVAGPATHAALALIDQFDSDLGTPASCGFDPTTDQVWVYGSSDATLSSFSRAGVALGTVARPGESANDVDINVASSALTLGSTPLPAGTLLFINGESGVAEIYAVDKSTGAVLATLATAFGASHVVGGGYHAARNTFFLVQDRQPSGTVNDNLIAEIDPITGSVLNSFATTSVLSTFSVNFGDLEVGPNGNLFVVSSDETAILECTPSGAFVQALAFPAGPSSVSGIGLDFGRGEAWISGTGGTVWHLGGLPSSAPLGRPVLSVGKGAASASMLDWPAVVGATGYDVVRGDLDSLRQTVGDFTLAATDCLANDVTTLPVQDATGIGAGEGRWYVVRAVGSGGPGTYDAEGTSQQGSRDLEIAASGFDCP